MKTKLILTILIAIINFANVANAQMFELPNLTKKQMYADFDEFVKIVEDCAVQLPAKKLVTGFDNLAEIKKLRKYIDTVSNTENFYKIINKALYLIQDDNIFFATDFHSDFENLYDIDTNYIKQYANYQREKALILTNKVQLKNELSMTASYFDDNYYIIGDNIFACKDSSKDSLKIHIAKVLSIAGEPILDYVEKQILKIPFVARWDFLKYKFYAGNIWLPIEGVLKVEQDGKIFDINIEDYIYNSWSSTLLSIKIEGVPKDGVDKKNNAIQFFEKDSILYIFPYIGYDMYEKQKFIEKVKESGKNKTIKKVIIDVRRCSYYSDTLWLNVLKAIIKNPVSYKIDFAYNDTEMMRKKFKEYEKISNPKTIKWLNEQKVRIVEKNEYISPDDNSLKYDGKIYILKDNVTSSATNSFVTSCNYLEQLVSVGTVANRLVGIGCETITNLFQLKNSKFTFRLQTTIDLTNCTKPEDVWHAIPEIIVNPTFDEFLYQHSIFDILSKEYLYKYDSMFKKVLEIK